jgi:hypothetical protein
MKKIFLVLIGMLFARAVLAQKELLSFNEKNKYTYFEVIGQPWATIDTLKDRALYFLKAIRSEVKIKQNDTGAITATGKFAVYSGFSISRHQSGEIQYNLNIIYKDQKYKYWLTDFVFTPYKLDRYGSYMPETGIEIPIETGLSKLEKKPYESYLDQTGAFCKNIGIKLKQYMLRISALPPKDARKKVISTKDW